MVIKAIETEYAGILFRSRLEARWAMFFTLMGYTWEYEPEGYILEDGTKYIPDFKVAIPTPQTKGVGYYYVEVKPLRHLKKQEILKAQLLVKGGDLPLILVQGIPAFRNYFLFFKTLDNGVENVTVMDVLFDETYYGLYAYRASELPLPIAFSNNINQKNSIDAARSFRFEYSHKKKRGY